MNPGEIARLKRKAFLYYLLILIEGAATEFFILSSPSASKTTLALGMTPYRLGMALVVGLLSLAMAFMAAQALKGPEGKRVVLPEVLRKIIPVFILPLAFTLWGIYFPEDIPLGYHPLFERAAPVLVFIAVIALQTFLFFPLIGSKLNHYFGIGAIVLCLAILLVGMQYETIRLHQGGDYVRAVSYLQHNQVIHAEMLAPRRYRVLSDYLLEFFMKIHPIQKVDNTAILSSQDWQDRPIYIYPYEVITRDFRMIQNLILFGLAYAWFAIRTRSRNLAILGLALLGISVFSTLNDDLALDVYSETIFFLTVGLLIEKKWDISIIPLTFIAALNREGAVFIPVLYMVSDLNWRYPLQEMLKLIPRKKFIIFTISMLLFAAVYMGLRLVLGDARYANSGYGKVFPGFLLFYLNLTNPNVWQAIWHTFHVLLLSLFLVRYWDMRSRFEFVFFIIPWYLITFFMGSPMETRLLLVPIAFSGVLLFLLSIQKWRTERFSH
jgi:MFS family permease